MKIRSDFVTNSSSSSFILGFKNKKSIDSEIEENFPKEYHWWRYERASDTEKLKDMLLKDIHAASKMTKKQVVNAIVMNKFKRQIWDKQLYLVRKRAMNFIQAEKVAVKEVKSSSEYKEAEKEIAELLGDNTYFCEVEYGDHDFPEMECGIMQELANTLDSISHH